MDYKRRNGGPVMGDAPKAKWAKMSNEWEDSPSQFEEELLMLDEMDTDDLDGQACHDVIPVGAYCTEIHRIENLTCFFFMCLQFILKKKLILSIFCCLKKLASLVL